ncbi:hypothetical protein K523DRAFT_343152 [Schizophyllum commune Tattone D]|nr:hypothetical protein K523DRAFT_343152 [Schizophyllum commune Tattone D]
MLTVEPSLDDLLSTAFFSTPFRRRRESLQCGRTHVLYRSVDCPTRRPPCPTVTRGTIGGRRHAYRKSIELVTTRVTNLLLPTTTSTPDDDPDCMGRRARQSRRFYDPQTAGGMHGDSRVIDAKIIAIHPTSRFSRSLRTINRPHTPRLPAPPPPRAAGGMHEAPGLSNAEMLAPTDAPDEPGRSLSIAEGLD